MNINPNSINEPLVSIIMGVYNAEKTMQDSIDSKYSAANIYKMGIYYLR